VSARPADWSPLAGSDPIGGDVATVASEARYYSDLAREISDQAAKLRKIASEGEQIGKVADKLRDVANDTAGKLDQTHGRVAAVGEALTSWIPHLDSAQSETLAALNQAKDALARQQANADPPAGTAAPKTDDEKAAAKARSSRLSDANNDLAAARTRFDNAVSERDSQASKAAGHIKDALDDGLKDSWWDSFCDWVSQHVDIIKMVVEILTWVATAVAIIALFIPGLNVLALALMIGVLAGHTLLAATGNGSWTDVLMDIVAIATFKIGSVLGKLGEEARAATLARAGDLAAQAKTVEVIESRAAQRALMEEATSGFGKFGSVRNFMNFLSLKSGAYDFMTAAKAGWQGAGARIAMLERELPEVGKLESLQNVGKDIAQNAKDYKLLSTAFGRDPQFAELASQWKHYINVQRVVAGTGQGLDIANHAATRSELPGLENVFRGVPAWENFKEQTTYALPVDSIMNRLSHIHIDIPRVTPPVAPVVAPR
jgi:hypothetical protein